MSFLSELEATPTPRPPKLAGATSRPPSTRRASRKKRASAPSDSSRFWELAPRLATALEPRLGELPPNTRGEVSPKVLARALGVLAGAALVERGGVWKTGVGSPLTVELQGETFSPLVAANDAISEPGRFAGLQGML